MMIKHILFPHAAPPVAPAAVTPARPARGSRIFHAVAVSDHGQLRVRLPGQVTVLLLGSWEAACAS